MQELEKHAEADVFSSTIRYQASTHARTFGVHGKAVLSNAEVVLTTYQEASRETLNNMRVVYFEANIADFKGLKVIS